MKLSTEFNALSPNNPENINLLTLYCMHTHFDASTTDSF